MTPELVESLRKFAQFFWRGVHWEVTSNGPRLVREPLKIHHLRAHDKVRVGLGFIAPGQSTTRVAALDFDSHKGEVPWEHMVKAATGVARTLDALGHRPLMFRSSGGKGVHIYLLWDEPQDAYSVREMLRTVLGTHSLEPGTKGVARSEVEVFPKQDSVPLDGYGNMTVLPMSGESLLMDWATGTLAGYDAVEDMRSWPTSPAVPVLEKPAREASPPIRELEGNLQTLRDALAAIPQETDPLDYDAWRNVIFGIHHATGGSEEGRALAHEFSARSAKYDHDFLDARVWDCIRDDREVLVTERSIYALARNHGWTDPTVIDDFQDLGPVKADADRDSAEPGTPSAALTGPNPFQFIPADEYVNRPAPSWIVRGVLPRTELVVIYGASKAGKSFLALDLAAAVTRGIPWRGKKVVQGEVAYIAAEGAAGFRNRVLAYKRHHEVNLPGLRVLPAAPNLLKPDQVKALAAAAGRPSLIVVDTLAQVIPGADENSAEHMGTLIASCKALHRLTGATVVLVHHAGKDPSKGMRGSSAVMGACDAVIEVTRGEGEQRVATIDKQKDGEDGAVFPFRLQVLPIGMDEEGEVIDSCVVEHLGELKRSTVAGKGRLERVVLETVDDLVSLADDQGVEVGEVLDLAVEKVPQDPEKRDRRRDSLRRAIDALVDSGAVLFTCGKLRRA